MLCKNCRYWKEGVEFNCCALTGVGFCTKAKPIWECADYLDENYEEVILLHPNNGMYCEDGSNYHAKLITEQGFGCVKFEDKGDEKCVRDLQLK